MIKLLDLKKQYLTIKNEIDNAISQCIENSLFIGGDIITNFEKNFALSHNVNYCVGVGNGTDALELAIESLNLPKSCEIIVPANSFIATSEAVTRCGHRVVFVDINEENYTICIDDLKTKITSKTKAIIAVHLYGHPCEMSKLNSIKLEYDLKLIEDCAQAHGAKYKNEFIGGLSDISSFSFYPGKNLGAYGDAGAVLTNNEKYANSVRMIANHGRIDKYNHILEGRNSRIDTIQAAILNVKLTKLNSWVERRNFIANKYLKELNGIDDIILPKKSIDVFHAYHLFVIRVKNRNIIQAKLLEMGIETGVHYPIALPKLKAYSYLNHNYNDMKACNFDSELLSLPIGEHLTDLDVDHVIKALKFIYNN